VHFASVCTSELPQLTGYTRVGPETVLEKFPFGDLADRAFLSGSDTVVGRVVKTVDYVEADKPIPRFGVIALQIHRDTRAEASYKEISVEEI
jgi:hypothetical protein